MKRMSILLPALAVLLFLGGVPTFAQRPSGAGKPPGVGPGAGANAGAAPAATHGTSGTTGSESGGHAMTVSDLLNQNKKLAEQISKLTGMDAQAACSGFKNLGECVAAAHVANNLGGSCTFTTLRGSMTGSSPLSLGKAVQSCDPHADAKAESKKAKKQADADLKSSAS
jgi:hypothetical protein